MIFLRTLVTAVLVAGLLLAGCGTSTPHDHDGHNGEHHNGEHGDHHGGEEEVEPIARTEFTDRLVNFFEFAPLEPGQASSFLIHLTDLQDGSPVAAANVRLVARDESGTPAGAFQAAIGKVTGIYVAGVKFDRAGTYTIDCHVKNAELDEIMTLPGFVVGGEPPAAGDGGAPDHLISFLMEQQWTIGLTLFQVEKTRVSRQVITTGRLVAAANSQAQVATPVAGAIVGDRLPTIGEEVGQEQLLARLLQSPSAAERAQIQSAVKQLQASQIQTRAQLKFQGHQAQVENARLAAEKEQVSGEVKEARARLELAKTEESIARQVFAVEGISRKEMERADTKLESARVEYETARKRLEALQAARPIESVRLDETLGGIETDPTFEVRAPFSARVTKVYKSLGETVAAGEALFELSRLDPIWLEASVFEKELGGLPRLATATFQVPAFPDREFRGTMIHLGEVIDKKTRAATATFRVRNPEEALRIGMQATVWLEAEGSLEAFLVPPEVVLENEGKHFVYVLASGEEFERREVVLGERYGRKVAILEGLKPGERVVEQGAYQLKLQELSPADPGVHSHET